MTIEIIALNQTYDILHIIKSLNSRSRIEERKYIGKSKQLCISVNFSASHEAYTAVLLCRTSRRRDDRHI